MARALLGKSGKQRLERAALVIRLVAMEAGVALVETVAEVPAARAVSQSVCSAKGERSISTRQLSRRSRSRRRAAAKEPGLRGTTASTESHRHSLRSDSSA